MPKRMTATEKWDDPWFHGLPAEGKLLWIYLLDRCNHAGIWDPNLIIAKAYLGFDPDLKMLGNRITKLKNGKIFISRFIEFQYGELSPKNKAHISVVAILKKNKVPFQGATKPLPSPYQGAIQGAKDKDKDKDKDMDMVKATDTNTKRGAFVPPSLDDVKEYCEERKNGLDAEKWMDHYTSNGWMVGKNKMKDWKAAVRTWEKTSFGNAPPPKREKDLAEWQKDGYWRKQEAGEC